MVKMKGEEKRRKNCTLERQLRELQEAKQQIAATVALVHNSRSFSPPKGNFKFLLKAGVLKFILAILVLLVILSVGIRLFAGFTSKQE